MVIGVMPRNFEFPLVPGPSEPNELWVPMSFTTAGSLTTGASSKWNFQMVGRLKPGVTTAQAVERCGAGGEGDDTQLAGVYDRASDASGGETVQEETVEAARPLVRTLFLEVIVVLLISCANLAGFYWCGRFESGREIAVRLALGATSARSCCGRRCWIAWC